MRHFLGSPMSAFDRYVKFTEMLNNAERELGISALNGLEKEIIYTVLKAEQDGEGLSFEDLLGKMNKPRATLYRHLQSLVDNGYLSKQRDPNDGRRNVLAVTI